MKRVLWCVLFAILVLLTSPLQTGATHVTLSSVHEVCVMVPDLASTDTDFEFWVAPVAVTVTAVGCHCRGTCTPTLAAVRLEKRSGGNMTGTPTCSTSTSLTTFTAITLDSTAQIAAGDGLRFDVTNTPVPSTDEYTICAKYTVD